MREQDGHSVSQAEADLKTAQLGARNDQIAAAEAEVRALQAALARAEWDLSQKRQSAPQEDWYSTPFTVRANGSPQAGR